MRLEDLIREAIQFGAHHKEEINNSGYDSYDATMKKFLNKHKVKNLFIHGVVGHSEQLQCYGCGCYSKKGSRYFLCNKCNKKKY